MNTKCNKQSQLEAAIARISEQHGTQALVRGQPPTAVGTATTVPHISTGFLSLDKALGLGGLPKGRVNELLGPATSGKTTLALKLLVHAQGSHGQVAYVDQSRSFDPDYAHRCGLDLSRLLVIAPYDLSEALAMTEALAGSGGLEAVVFDGLEVLWADAAAVSLLGSCLDRLVAPLARSRTLLLFLRTPASEGIPASSSLANARDKYLDRAQDGSFSPIQTTQPGSSALRALAHHATVRLNIIRERWLRCHGDISGCEAKVEVLKNRLGPAGRTVPITIAFDSTVRDNGF